MKLRQFLIHGACAVAVVLVSGVSVTSLHAQERTVTGTPTERTVTGTPTESGVTGSPSSGQTLVNPLKVGTLPELLKLVLEAVVYIGSIILTLAIIWVGFKFVAAQGNPEKIKDARNALVWTLIGGLILLGAQAISLAIQSTVGSLQAK